jgi:hypothetical protein
MRNSASFRQATSSAADRPRRLLAGILGLTVAAGGVQAGEIYKSVDANGTIVYSDHLDPTVSQTVVELEEGLAPHELHFCWTNCFTLILDNGVYRRIDGTDETWTVQTFSPKAIVLHRHDAPADWNGYSQDVVYAGQVANDRLIGVTVNGKPVGGIDASWGIALNTLPGSNAERDAKNTPNPGATNPSTPNPSTPNPSGSSSGSVSTAAPPPPLPEEQQPTLPEDGDLWTPGYWYWRNPGYIWIPGAWVRPPQVGVLWTPPYWSSAGAVFVFHPGHWGGTVGYYGGVNYGYGYSGNGYNGGHWIGNSFAYNSAINRVNPSLVGHAYAESMPNQGSRGVVQSSRGIVSFSGAPRTAAAHTDAIHQSQPRAFSTPITTTVQRTVEPARNAAELTRPAAGGTAAPTARPTIKRGTPTRAEPVK